MASNCLELPLPNAMDNCWVSGSLLPYDESSPFTFTAFMLAISPLTPELARS
jgi:hypothetical protein